MQTGITSFSARQPLDRQLGAANLNRIVRELDSLAIRKVIGGTFRKTPGGTEIVIDASSGGGKVQLFPFKITVSQAPDSSSSYLVSVRPGTINSLLPSNIFDTFSISENATKYVVLNGTTDGKQFTACTISLDSTAPPAQTPVVFGLPASPKFLLGIVRNTSVFQIISDNILVAGKQQYLKSKSAPAAAGELPYEIYFVWQ